MNEHLITNKIVESLRNGIPPQKGVSLYSAGNEKLLEGVKRFHFSNIENLGIIRFISGSWGAGKTHLFRQMRELAFQNECLVSNVELGKKSADLNKFETIFKAIVLQIVTPVGYENDLSEEAAPFGSVLYESLVWLATGIHQTSADITHEIFRISAEKLMRDHAIDIDFKKMIMAYWGTFLPDAPESVVIYQTREEILQWFTGEGVVSAFRKKFGVSKFVSKDNAKLMLHSLAAFVRLSGYKGLVILFDEAEQSYSGMRKTELKDAQNNLLSLINNIESLAGLFLIYATTPDFFSDPKHGIVTYGALSGRIGKPSEREPRALDTIWNLDTVNTSIDDYQIAARKIRKIYSQAIPVEESTLPDDLSLAKRVNDLYAMHSNYASIRFWRMFVMSLVWDFDDIVNERDHRSSTQLYDDVMDSIREK